MMPPRVRVREPDGQGILVHTPTGRAVPFVRFMLDELREELALGLWNGNQRARGGDAE